MKECFSQPYVLRWAGTHPLRLRPAVDERHHLGRPIQREHDLPAYAGQTDQQTMRAGRVRTCEEHLKTLAAAYSDEQIVAYVGDGNRLANFGFVLWLCGRLSYIADEPVFQRAYHCIVGWRDGRVTVEEVWFARENGCNVVLRRQAPGLEEITEAITFAASGQPLVRHGAATDLSEISEEWYDTRHLLRPIRLAVNGTSLYFPNAQLMQGLTRKGLVGSLHVALQAQVDAQTVLPLNTAGWRELIERDPRTATRAERFLKAHGGLGATESVQRSGGLLRAATFTEKLLAEGLREAGYAAIDHARPLEEGEYRFLNGHIEVALRKAVYPHNLFVRWADGSCGFVVFPGESGRRGTTLPAAQQFLTEKLQVEAAILLDNGGDVRLWYRGVEVVASSEGREQMRGLMALTAPQGACIPFGAVTLS